MKKIVISLNQKSVEQAVNYLKNLRRNIKRMMNEFLEFACEWLIERANLYIETSDIGDLVKMQLQNAWSYSITDGRAQISNSLNVTKNIGYGDNRTSETIPLSALIEFGVGVVGQSAPHPNAKSEGYEYNKDSESKSYDGSWTFFTDSAELDLPTDALVAHNWYRGSRGKGGEGGQRLLVMTRGTKGVMYAFNALVDAQIDLQNPNGDFATEWAKIKERYMV